MTSPARIGRVGHRRRFALTLSAKDNNALVDFLDAAQIEDALPTLARRGWLGEYRRSIAAPPERGSKNGAGRRRRGNDRQRQFHPRRDGHNRVWPFVGNHLQKMAPWTTSKRQFCHGGGRANRVSQCRDGRACRVVAGRRSQTCQVRGDFQKRSDRIAFKVGGASAALFRVR